MNEENVSPDGTNEEAVFTETNPNELDESLQPFYKSMQADYTRKTQELADQRSAFGEERSLFQQENANKFEELGTLKKEVEQWRAWSQTLNQDQGNDTGDDTWTNEAQDDTLEDRRFRGEIDQLRTELSAMRDQSQRSNEEVGRMLRYQDELNELKTEDPDINKDEMIDFMLKEGITDPKRAYKEMYQDSIIERQAQEKFEAMKAEFVEKQKADMLTGPGGPNIKSALYTPPEGGVPKSWEQAEDEVRMEHAKSQIYGN